MSGIEINYTTELAGYALGARPSQQELAQRDHSAATATVAALLRSVYELNGELRGMGPAAHALLGSRDLPPLRQRLSALLQAVHELQYDLASLRGRFVAPQLRALGIDGRSTDLKVHIGCGGHELEGWVNVDNYPAPLAINLDWGLPLPDRSARYVFLAHLLEHLFHPQQSGLLLAEIRRVLAPGGIVRVVVPDIEKCMRAYVDGDHSFFAGRRRQWRLPEDTTNLESFLAYAGVGPDPESLFEHHKFGYDFDTLARSLERAGFVNVRRCAYLASPHAELRVDHASSNASAKNGEEHYSLFVEAEV
jgi:predicted SAM-dependent methyltransferase